MTATVPAMFAGLCDDAAVFPPGNLRLEQAVPAHLGHMASGHAALVGAFVLAARDIDRLAPLVADLARGTFALSVTTALPDLTTALGAIESVEAVTLDAVEVALPDDLSADEVVPLIERSLAGRRVDVFVELPRDERRPALVAALSGTRLQAKLRTGGIVADLYPDEDEIALAVVSLVAARVPFKATAGLHHAVRNTDPETGFEQHGFLNVLAATGAALTGSDQAELAAVLADRDGVRIADLVSALPADVRTAFRSFGTCSISGPVDDLTALGLLDTSRRQDLP